MNWKEFKALTIFVATFMFFLSFMLIDYGATMRISGGHAESLVFSFVEPRIVYHSGILLGVLSFLGLFMVSVSELITYVEDEEG